MKRALVIAAMAATSMLASSCMLGKYEELEHTHQILKRDFNANLSELADMRDENAELQRQNQSLAAQVTELTEKGNAYSDSITAMQQRIASMKMGFDTVEENYAQRLTGKTRELNRTNNLLAERTLELNQKEATFLTKEAAFQAKEAAFLTKEAIFKENETKFKENEAKFKETEAKFKETEAKFKEEEKALKEKQAELEKKEAATRQALEAQEKKLETLRNTLTNALVSFTDKGMNVETRQGKVYVSMDSKLLFPSASWTVSKEGVQAIKSLAKVLESNTDLNILVEGHTDNAAYKGSTAVKDNWDLSVMRATSIVKLLLQYGPGIDPARIEACGHGEFAPKVPNDTPANKALNRRTEIILSPKVTDILKIIE